MYNTKQSKETVDKRIETRKINKEEKIANGTYEPKKRVTSLETKLKQSKASKGKNKNPESVKKSVETRKINREEKISNGTYVKPVRSEESRKKQSASMMGKTKNIKRSPEAVQKGVETAKRN